MSSEERPTACADLLEELDHLVTAGAVDVRHEHLAFEKTETQLQR